MDFRQTGRTLWVRRALFGLKLKRESPFLDSFVGYLAVGNAFFWRPCCDSIYLNRFNRSFGFDGFPRDSSFAAGGTSGDGSGARGGDAGSAGAGEHVVGRRGEWELVERFELGPGAGLGLGDFVYRDDQHEHGG